MVLEFRQVEKIYSGSTHVQALRGVTLSLPMGAFAGVVGPSGSGKSTLLHLAAGLDSPTAGSVHIEGVDLASLNRIEKARFRRKRIGFVFQNFNLFPSLTVIENVEYVLQMDRQPRKKCQEQAISALQAVGLAELASRFPNQLSGGQQQRVAVARAVASRPAVILADEPTANLDSKNANILIDVFSELNLKFGTTFLFSTHDSRLVFRIGTLIQLVDGLIVEPETESELE